MPSRLTLGCLLVGLMGGTLAAGLLGGRRLFFMIGDVADKGVAAA